MIIGIADPQGRLRFSLHVLLDQQPGWVVPWVAADCGELVEMMRRDPPDLLLLDWNLADQLPEHSLRMLRLPYPHLKIIVLSGRRELQQTALREGADAFACKAEPPENLLSLIRELQEP